VTQKILGDIPKNNLTTTIDVCNDYSDQSHHFLGELLSRYPVKEISLDEARTLLSSRLKDRTLSSIIRENRDTQ
jgi:hypothetical protein